MSDGSRYAEADHHENMSVGCVCESHVLRDGEYRSAPLFDPHSIFLGFVFGLVRVRHGWLSFFA